MSAKWAPFTTELPSANINLMWLEVFQEGTPTQLLFNMYLSNDNKCAIETLSCLLSEALSFRSQSKVIIGCSDANVNLFSTAQPGRGCVKDHLLFVLSQLGIGPVPSTDCSFTREQKVLGKFQRSFIDFLFLPLPLLCSDLNLQIEREHSFVDPLPLPLSKCFLTDFKRAKKPSDHKLISVCVPTKTIFPCESKMVFRYDLLDDPSHRTNYRADLTFCVQQFLSSRPVHPTPDYLVLAHSFMIDAVSDSLSRSVGKKPFKIRPMTSRKLAKEANDIKQLCPNEDPKSRFLKIQSHLMKKNLSPLSDPDPFKSPKLFWKLVGDLTNPSKNVLREGPPFEDHVAYGHEKFGAKSFSLYKPDWVSSMIWDEIVLDTRNFWESIEQTVSHIKLSPPSNPPIVSLKLVRDSLLSASLGAVGPTGIKGIALRAAADALTPMVHAFITDCLKIGFVPENVVLSFIIWIRKNGKPHLLTDSYRPITLACIFGKVIETIFGRLLKNYLPHPLSLPEQFASKKGFSTDMISFILRSLVESNKTLYFGFLDIKGAFDHMWSSVVWSSLFAKNVPISLIKCLISMYCNRPSSVKVREKISRIFNILDGTPQGSPNSSDLFCIFMDSLISELRSLEGIKSMGARAFSVLVISLIFMDDVTVVATSPCSLQTILSSVWLWSLRHKATFGIGPGKTEVMPMVKGGVSENYSWYFGNHPLSTTKQRKMLSVVLSSDGKWLEHCKFWCNKAFVSLLLISKSHLLGPKVCTRTAMHVIRSKVHSIGNTDRCVLFAEGHGNQTNKCLEPYSKLLSSCLKTVFGIPEKVNIPHVGMRGELGQWSPEGTSHFLFLKFYFRLHSSHDESIQKQILLAFSRHLKRSGPNGYAQTANFLLLKYGIDRDFLNSKKSWSAHISSRVHLSETAKWKEDVKKCSSLLLHLKHSKLEMRPYLCIGPFPGCRILTQCRLNSLPLNSIRSKIDSSKSPLCDFCGCVEDLSHFLLSCSHPSYCNLRKSFLLFVSSHLCSLNKPPLEILSHILLFSDMKYNENVFKTTGLFLRNMWLLRARALELRGIQSVHLGSL